VGTGGILHVMLHGKMPDYFACQFIASKVASRSQANRMLEKGSSDSQMFYVLTVLSKINDMDIRRYIELMYDALLWNV